MKSGQNSSNQSAIKRIVPAVAMFALSAVMLSSSTYAWFTMNKEVEMTGLSMSAAAGSGMEIALASVTGENNQITDGQPDDSDTEKGWNSSVVVGRYYSDIGKLKPASSVNGTIFFDATNASNKGKTASEYKKIDLEDSTNNYNMAKVAIRNTLVDDTDIGSTGGDGYYVDIPVYLRTNKVKIDSSTNNINCKIKIKNENSVTAEANDLSNAVRVAFIPITDNTGSTTKIFGVNADYHTNEGAAASEGGKGTVNVVKDCVSATNDFADITGADSGLKIPLASTAGTYGHLDFKVRVWLEGESAYCFDDTSGQNWNIDLAFEMVEPTTP